VVGRYFIERACSGMTSFRLEPLDKVMLNEVKRKKRDVATMDNYDFLELTGKSAIAYKILNLNEL